MLLKETGLALRHLQGGVYQQKFCSKTLSLDLHV
uniref:Uncharacterized protein n=1 Tax=Anguilla anguilla TaxID=7936 RepID=A0A0E9U6V8_ANGAN